MIRDLQVSFSGIDQLIHCNPATVDPLHPLSKEKKRLQSKRNKTDEVLLQIRDLDIRAALYWEDKVIVPSSWVLAAINNNAFSISKISKAKCRGAIFAKDQFLTLNYEGQEKVKEPLDIVKQSEFHYVVPLKQGQVRIVKAFPCFKKWSFSCDLEYDDMIVQEDDIKNIINYAARYGGFGNFRPTFGRCEVSYG